MQANSNVSCIEKSDGISSTILTTFEQNRGSGLHPAHCSRACFRISQFYPHAAYLHQQDGFMPPMPALQTPPSPSSHAYSRHISCSNFDYYFQIFSESKLRFNIVTSARSAISKVTRPDSSFVAIVTVSVPLTSSITLSSTFSTTAQLRAGASGLLDCVSDGFAA